MSEESDRKVEEMMSFNGALYVMRAGIKTGLSAYAWWRDGEQFVGTTGRTLKEALAMADRGVFDDQAKIKMLVGLAKMEDEPPGPEE